MHRLIKIRIIRDFEQMEERWRWQPDVWFGSSRPHLHFRPAADFYETAQGLVLRLEVAGIQPESLCLSLAGQELVVEGRRQPPPPEGIRRLSTWRWASAPSSAASSCPSPLTFRASGPAIGMASWRSTCPGRPHRFARFR